VHGSEAEERTLTAVLARIPQLRDFDGPLQDEEGEEEQGGGAQLGAGAEPPDSASLQRDQDVSPAAYLGAHILLPDGAQLPASQNGQPALLPIQSDDRVINTAMDMLDNLERSCMDVSAPAMRHSVQRPPVRPSSASSTQVWPGTAGNSKAAPSSPPAELEAGVAPDGIQSPLGRRSNATLLPSLSRGATQHDSEQVSQQGGCLQPRSSSGRAVSSATFEAQIAADLTMLRARVQMLVEPLTAAAAALAASHTSSAGSRPTSRGHMSLGEQGERLGTVQ
jgi:hypothetical protein